MTLPQWSESHRELVRAATFCGSPTFRTLTLGYDDGGVSAGVSAAGTRSRWRAATAVKRSRRSERGRVLVGFFGQCSSARAIKS